MQFQQGLLQGEQDTDIVREARKTVRLGEEGERPCEEGACQSEGDSDGVGIPILCIDFFYLFLQSEYDCFFITYIAFI